MRASGDLFPDATIIAHADHADGRFCAGVTKQQQLCKRRLGRLNSARYCQDHRSLAATFQGQRLAAYWADQRSSSPPPPYSSSESSYSYRANNAYPSPPSSESGYGHFQDQVIINHAKEGKCSGVTKLGQLCNRKRTPGEYCQDHSYQDTTIQANRLRKYWQAERSSGKTQYERNSSGSRLSYHSSSYASAEKERKEQEAQEKARRKEAERETKAKEAREQARREEAQRKQAKKEREEWEKEQRQREEANRKAQEEERKNKEEQRRNQEKAKARYQ